MGLGSDLRELGRKIDDYAHEVVDEALEDPLETILTGGLNVVNTVLFEDVLGDLILDPLVDALVDIPELPDTESADSALEITQSGADKHIPIVYGRAKVGGILIAPPFISGASNEYAHFVFAVCEGEIDSFESILINNIDSTDSQYTGLVLTEVNTGTDNQAAFTQLVSDVTEWTTNHRMRGVACAHIRLKRDPEVFRGWPDIKFIIKGRKCYDPRTATTIYTENNIIQSLDYLTNSRFGKGETVTDYTDWITAANICDATIQEFSGGGNIPRFANNIILDSRANIKKNLQKLLLTCRGHLYPANPEYSPYINDAGSSVFSFSESNIIGSVAVALGSKDSRKNKVTIKYKNNDTWKTDAQVYASSTLKAEDNGYELSMDISQPGEVNKYRALDFAETVVKMSRDAMSVSFTAELSALAVEIGDIVSLSNEAYGFTNKLFRVGRKSFNPSTLTLSFSLLEHYDSFYNRDIPAEQATPADTSLPNAMAKPSAVTGLALTTGQDVVQEAAASIVADWDDSDYFFLDHYSVTVTASGKTQEYKTSGSNFVLSQAELGVSHTITVAAVSTTGVRGTEASSSIVALESNKLYSKKTNLIQPLVKADGVDISAIYRCNYENGYFYLSGAFGGSGRNGTSLRSKNGAIFKPTGLVVLEESFYDVTDNTGWVMVVGQKSTGDPVMYRSVSGPTLSFSAVTLPALSDELITIASSLAYAVAITYKFEVITSSDWGATWTLRSMPVPTNPYGGIKKVIFVPATGTFLAFGGTYDTGGTNEETYIARSTNIGVTWTQITPAGLTEWLHHATVDPETGRIVAVGDRGVIISSTDDGLTWTKETNPNEGPNHSRLAGVCFADGVGWACGTDYVYRSIKNDGVWELVLDDEVSLLGAASNGTIAVFGGTHGSTLDYAIMTSQA